MEPRIVTRHLFPPIPVRQFDWCAYYAGQEEKGQYGYGQTEREAVDDLLNNWPLKEPLAALHGDVQ